MGKEVTEVPLDLNPQSEISYVHVHDMLRKTNCLLWSDCNLKAIKGRFRVEDA